MVIVNFQLSSGERISVTTETGNTVLDAALDNNVPGIHGQCGGGCTCCTCHCYVAAPWFERALPSHPDEIEMLAYAWRRQDHSRLACQVVLEGEDFNNIEIEIPERQA